VDQLLAVEDVQYSNDLPETADVLWAFTDNQNTVRELFGYNSATGANQVLQSFQYNPYGQLVSFSAGTTTANTNLSALSASYQSLVCYAGHFLDPETGLYYAKARYYQAACGRFTTQDPFGFAAGTTNLYVYCGDDPMDGTDPNGLLDDPSEFCSEPPAGVISGVGALHLDLPVPTRPAGADIVLVQGGSGPSAVGTYQFDQYRGDRWVYGLRPTLLRGTGLPFWYTAPDMNFVQGPSDLSGYQNVSDWRRAGSFGATFANAATDWVIGTGNDMLGGFFGCDDQWCGQPVPQIPQYDYSYGIDPTQTLEQHREIKGHLCRAVDGLAIASSAVPKLVGLGSSQGAAPATLQRTNAQLVQDIATRADTWAAREGITGTPQQLGIAKHGYAEDLLNRYQQMFGDRGLQTEVSVINRGVVDYGTAGSVRLDVLEGNVANPTAIYDYKFGTSGLTPGRINQIRTIGGYGPGVPIIPVRP
jgi:RHS repeat-associated protein